MSYVSFCVRFWIVTLSKVFCQRDFSILANIALENCQSRWFFCLFMHNEQKKKLWRAVNLEEIESICSKLSGYWLPIGISGALDAFRLGCTRPISGKISTRVPRKKVGHFTLLLRINRPIILLILFLLSDWGCLRILMGNKWE